MRLVANQIAPHSTSLLSRLTKTKPTFFATPGQASYEAIKATEVAETLLDFWWDKFNLSEKREEAILWGIICGNGFWKISWDDKVGSSVKLMLNPDGEPIVNPIIEHLFKDRLGKMGLDAGEFEKEVFEGEIKVDVMAPFDVLLDDSAPGRAGGVGPRDRRLPGRAPEEGLRPPDAGQQARGDPGEGGRRRGRQGDHHVR